MKAVKLSKSSTSWPSATSFRATCEPISPAPPVRKMRSSLIEPSSVGRRAQRRRRAPAPVEHRQALRLLRQALGVLHLPHLGVAREDVEGTEHGQHEARIAVQDAEAQEVGAEEAGGRRQEAV